ncbi:MAG TPA: hypothetical protein VKU35_04535 [Candidatus Limnocylindria bacterium]|nr:hypothetical protein [Candidatus Limnocylindria bacterium]
MHRYARTGAIAIAATALALGLASTATAHIVKQVGPYTVAIGWLREPTYVGELNAVQVVIKDKSGNPVSDLTADDLRVVVTASGTQSDPMALAPTFDPDTALGIPGDYEAPLIPTAPGAYTFHVTGTIHNQPIDETATSAEDTFDSAVLPTAIQFPDALPALGDVATRIERTDARAQAAGVVAQQAKDAAGAALIGGIAVGSLGVLLGAAGLVVAMRRRPVA